MLSLLSYFSTIHLYVLFFSTSVRAYMLLPEVALRKLLLYWVVGLHWFYFEKVLANDNFFNYERSASLGSKIGSILLNKSDVFEGALKVFLFSKNHLLFLALILPSSLSIILKNKKKITRSNYSNFLLTIVFSFSYFCNILLSLSSYCILKEYTEVSFILMKTKWRNSYIVWLHFLWRRHDQVWWDRRVFVLKDTCKGLSGAWDQKVCRLDGFYCQS